MQQTAILPKFPFAVYPCKSGKSIFQTPKKKIEEPKNWNKLL